MTDVLYMSFTNMEGETRLDVRPTLEELDALSRLKRGVYMEEGGERHIAFIDFPAKRPAFRSLPASSVWVRVVCQTATPLNRDQQCDIVQAARLGGLQNGVIAEEIR